MLQLQGLQSLRQSFCSLNSPSNQGSFSSDYSLLELHLSSLPFLTLSAPSAPVALTTVLCYPGAAVPASTARVPTVRVSFPFCAIGVSVADGCCSRGPTSSAGLNCSCSSLLLSVQPADWLAPSLSLLWVTRLPQVRHFTTSQLSLLLWFPALKEKAIPEKSFIESNIRAKQEAAQDRVSQQTHQVR